MAVSDNGNQVSEIIPGPIYTKMCAILESNWPTNDTGNRSGCIAHFIRVYCYDAVFYMSIDFRRKFQTINDFLLHTIESLGIEKSASICVFQLLNNNMFNGTFKIWVFIDISWFKNLN